jgi:cytochrome c peroxidase
MKTHILALILSSVLAVGGYVPHIWRVQASGHRDWRGGNCSDLAADPARPKWKEKYLRPAAVPFPDDNRYSKDRELLGRTLFFDPRLSRSGSISCGSCHKPERSWDDGLAKPVGEGLKQEPRRTPTILNLAWADLLFWDGRADDLEHQALIPIASEGEMNQPLDEMVRIVNGIQGYRALFAAAYPNEPIDARTITRAIATFERTVVSGKAPFDRWIDGDESAISEQAKRGFDLFNGKAACAKCHSGWNFTDNGFHDIGVESGDRGRGAILDLDAMQFAFKTPTLRNAGRRGPFMHDGSEQALQGVIEFYDRGGRVRRASLAPEIAPLHFSVQEKEDLLAFLASLTSVDTPVEMPALPR